LNERFRIILLEIALENPILWTGMKGMAVEDRKNADRRLLEVARALASEPVVTLLDEPMAGLNPLEITNMIQVIEKAREEKYVVI
jgi:ABC-type branched-subunit amino acid transport system ATPase component